MYRPYCPKLTGPFQGANAVLQFRDACGIEIGGEAPIMFTNDDLVSPNILVSPGLDPKVAAVIDWGQAGWYYTYWAYCKARRVGLHPEHFNGAAQEEWRRSVIRYDKITSDISITYVAVQRH